MIPVSQKELEQYEAVLEEFKGLYNDQAYVHLFSQRMMKPVPNKQAEYYGCDQRIDFLPLLQKIVNILPDKAQIFDVGAGAGEIVDFALKDAPAGSTINIEEPNSILLETYLKRLDIYPHLKVGIAYQDTLQSYYKNCEMAKIAIPRQPQNLITAIHMIYHLTDFTQPKIDPEKDLIEGVSFLYNLLATGGSLFIVYADLSAVGKNEAVCGLGEKFFRAYYPDKPFADNLKYIYKARNHLLGLHGTITTILEKQFPKSKPELSSERRNTHFFGDSIADIAVLALATELCPSDTEKFDINKLKFCMDYICKYPERIGLEKETQNTPQKGMWRANEPQIISVITRNL